MNQERVDAFGAAWRQKFHEHARKYPEKYGLYNPTLCDRTCDMMIKTIGTRGIIAVLFSDSMKAACRALKIVPTQKALTAFFNS